MTCAGGTSVLHLAAQIIERHRGRSHALKSLRILIDEEPLPSDAWQPEQIVTCRATDAIVRRAMLLIEQDLAGASSPGEIAAQVGIGFRQLNRRFIVNVGLTTKEYRAQVRLARAHWLTRHTGQRMNQHVGQCALHQGAAPNYMVMG